MDSMETKEDTCALRQRQKARGVLVVLVVVEVAGPPCGSQALH